MEPTEHRPSGKRILLTGVTGFVGAHLRPVLEKHGFQVVGGTRQPEKARKDAPHAQFCQLDLDDRASVDAALASVDAAVYLVHSMAEQGNYAKTEQKDAETFRDAAARRGLERIVYLGGMRPNDEVSHHLMSRLQTGETLRSGPVPTIELQATMVVGGGSESFRIVRDLAARLPWMLLPKWLKSASEPIAIEDIAAAVVRALEMPVDGPRVLEAPGPERLTGREMILRTARALGHDPRVVDVPFVTPRLSSYWIRLVTRANPHVATELVEGLKSNIVSEGRTIWDEMPGYERTSFDEAVRKALKEEDRNLPARSRVLERVLHAFTPHTQPAPAVSSR